MDSTNISKVSGGWLIETDVLIMYFTVPFKTKVAILWLCDCSEGSGVFAYIYIIVLENYSELVDFFCMLWLQNLVSAGDHVIVGSREGKMCWFDLDYSSKPYKTLKYDANLPLHYSFLVFSCLFC